MNNPEVVLEDLLATDAWIQALARRLVVDDEEAKDVAQDAWVKALIHRPEKRGPIRRWMGTVVRNLAVNRRSSDVHRAERERAAAKPERIPSVAELWDQEQLRRRVAVAVFSLEEPYRSAVLYRYFSSMLPSEIAEHLGVSVSAVESRLRRGLQKLRARLDRDFGDRKSWCAALLPLTGLTAGEATAASASTAGALIMGIKVKNGIAVALLAIVTLVTLVLFRPDPRRGVPPPSSSAETESVASAQSSHPEEDSSSGAGTSAASELKSKAPKAKETATAAAMAPRSAVARGRCVAEESGYPLAECEVQLVARPEQDKVYGRVWRRAEDRMVATGATGWKAPEPTRTGADGRFELKFAVAPDRPVVLRVRRADRATMQQAWPRIGEHEEVDLGDLRLVRGFHLRGRVVDSVGCAQPGVRLTVGPVQTGAPPPFSPVRNFWVRSESDGSFLVPEPVAEGTWWFRPFGRWLIEEGDLHVRVSTSNAQVRVVLLSLDAITGKVTDSEGKPIPNVEVGFTANHSPRVPNFSDKAGNFRIEREAKESNAPVPLYFEKDGYEPHLTSYEVAWGTAGIHVALRRGLPMTVRVADAASGEPVERFGLRCFRIQETLIDPDRGRQLRCVGSHPGGVVTLESVRRGPNVLLVEPLGDKYAPSAFHEIMVTESGLVATTVQVARTVRRSLSVKRQVGSVVAGSRVQLVRPPLQGRFDLNSKVGRPSHLRSPISYKELGLLLLDGVTDTNGMLDLSGPGNERLALRILGPGHPPFIVHDVSLIPSKATLEVTVPTGGTILGEIGPADVLRRLAPGKNAIAQSWSNPDPKARAQFLDRHRPGIRVVEHGKPAVATGKPWYEGKILLDREGRFRIEGIKPGSWDVYFNFSLDSGNRWSCVQNQLLATVRNLRMGETRQLELNVDFLREGMLTGTLFHYGKPLAERNVTFSGTRTDREGRTLRVVSRAVRTDRHGRFSVGLFTGRYRASVLFPQVGKGSATRLESRETVEVFSGGQTAQDFHLSSARLTIRILAPDGKTPVRGLRLSARFEGWVGIELAPSDQHGEVVIDPTPCGQVTFRAFPLGAQTVSERRALRRKGQRAESLSLGSIEVPAGEKHVRRTVILPPESGY